MIRFLVYWGSMKKGGKVISKADVEEGGDRLLLLRTNLTVSTVEEKSREFRLSESGTLLKSSPKRRKGYWCAQ